MKRIVLHPIFFAAYPILAVWAQNIQELDFSQANRALLFSQILLLLVWLIFWWLIGDFRKSALVASLVIILFFSYGHVYDTIRVWSFEFARHRYLLPVFGCLFLFGTHIIWRLKTPEQWTHFLNLSGIVLLLMTAYTIGKFQISMTSQYKKQSSIVMEQKFEDQDLDIYYIIVDGYGRQDILLEKYGFDNSDFIAFLEQKGFYIAENSKSNYRKTVLSLSSSLNMTYVQDLLPDTNPKSKDYSEILNLLKHSTVRELLAEQGYHLITVDTGIKTSITDADILLKVDTSSLEKVDLSREGYSIDLNEFEGLLIQTSLAQLWVDWQVTQGKENMINAIAVEAPYNRHRLKIQYSIDSITRQTDIDGNKFFFIHILAPHPPFVFGPNGEQVKHDRLFTIADGPYSQGSQDDYVRGYTNQISYLNKQLMKAIESLLERPGEKPIIIIQGDHGPKAFSHENVEVGDFTENFAILNAYYFPDGNYTRLYPEISPVNSFRIVFNQYFGMDFELLEDESYFSNVVRPFDFIRVTEHVK